MGRFSGAYLKSLDSPELRDLAIDGADIVADSLLHSELIDKIPIISTIHSIYKASKSFQEELLIRKISCFLNEARDISQKEKETFLEEIKESEEKIGTSLLVLIDKSEDIDKPRIFGRLLVACTKGHFTASDMMRLCKMVNRAISEDFQYLKNMHAHGCQRKNEGVEQALYSAGFLKLSNIDQGMLDVIGSGSVEYTITDYGNWLINLGLSDGPVPEYKPAPDLFGFK